LAAGLVDEGVDVRIREDFAERVEDTLSPAVGDEPIMDQGDLHGRDF
jgi:hypothetical protein